MQQHLKDIFIINNAGYLVIQLITSSTEEDAGYSNRLSVGTLQSQMIRGDRRSRILTFCCQLCWRQQPTPAETEGTVQAESMMPLKQSRSFNALCSADSLKQTNGYKTTSRSTDDLIEEIKSKQHITVSVECYLAYIMYFLHILPSSWITFCFCIFFQIIALDGWNYIIQLREQSNTPRTKSFT